MLTRLLLALLKFYRLRLSPLTGDCCRFEPSCSRYAELCVTHHKPRRAIWLVVKRLARCNPLCAGGVD